MAWCKRLLMVSAGVAWVFFIAVVAVLCVVVVGLALWLLIDGIIPFVDALVCQPTREYCGGPWWR